MTRTVEVINDQECIKEILTHYSKKNRSRKSKEYQDGFNHIKSIAKITYKGQRTSNGKTETVSFERYFVSSKIMNAKTFGFVVREHWAIENKLHFMLDVMMNEDKSCNMNIIKKLVLAHSRRIQKAMKITMRALNISCSSSVHKIMHMLTELFKPNPKYIY